MAQSTSIEWTDFAYNPIRGCIPIAPGCDHCYARTFAERWRGVEGHPYEAGFDPRIAPLHILPQPLHWRLPRRVFVNSMSDLMLKEVPHDYRAAIWAVILTARRHTFQALTKRAFMLPRFFDWLGRSDATIRGRMLDAAEKYLIQPQDLAQVTAAIDAVDDLTPPLANLWLGVTVENRKHGLPRIEQLRVTPAAIRFLSIEPLLEDLGAVDLTGIDWVIVGGESGPGARPMHEDWVRALLSQCKAANVAFFFKQWGGVRKAVHGRELDGRTYDEFPRARAA